MSSTFFYEEFRQHSGWKPCYIAILSMLRIVLLTALTNCCMISTPAAFLDAQTHTTLLAVVPRITMPRGNHPVACYIGYIAQHPPLDVGVRPRVAVLPLTGLSSLFLYRPVLLFCDI